MNYQIVSIRNRDGDTEIHKAGCAHLSRLLPYHRAVTGERNGGLPRLPVAAMCARKSTATRRDRSSRKAGWTDYDEFMEMVDTNYLHFAPCTDHIP